MKLSVKPWCKPLMLASLIATAGMGINSNPAHAYSTDPSKPNVLVIVMDDLGIGQLDFALSSLNKDQLQKAVPAPRYKADLDKLMEAARTAMPNVNELAKSGVSLSNAFVAHPVSGPSRAAIFTGKQPGSFGIYSNDDAFHGIPLDQTLLPKLFQQNGYTTANIGKFHNAKVNKDRKIGRIYRPENQRTRDYHDNWSSVAEPGYAPHERGFDYSYSYYVSGAALYDSPAFWRNGESITSYGYITHNLTDETIKFIDQSKDKPFFINLAYSVPHIPLEQASPAVYMDKFNTGNVEADKYYAALNAADDGIGRILADLKAKGILDNTLIFFTSDNGSVHEAPLPRNGNDHGYKGQAYNGGLHVPLIVSYPNKIPAATQNATMVSAIDILPTALAAAGIEIPKSLGVEGKNLLPLLTGKETTQPHQYLFWAGAGALHYSEENIPFWAGYWDYITYRTNQAPVNPNLEKNAKGMWAVRDGQYALVFYNGKNKVLELYDEKADPAYLNNLASKNPAKVEELRAAFYKWITAQPTPLEWNPVEFQALIDAAAPKTKTK